MKKFILGTIVGVLVGAAVILWLRPQPHDSPPETKPAETATNEPGLHLSKEQQAEAGVVVTNPVPVEWQPEVKGFGRVLDATPLAALLAEIDTAEAATTASAREYERLKTLGENASVRALEAAEAAMKRDRALSESAHSRLLAGWGKALAERTDLAALTHSLLAQESALARVEVPAGEQFNGAPSAIRIARVAGNGTLQAAELLGAAPSADLQGQGQAFLVLIRAPGFLPGMALTAQLATDGAKQNGFLLPTAAVVQYERGMFVFLQTGDETFERKRVEVGPPRRDGVFVSSGVAAEDRVVTVGAQALLSEELKGGGE